MKTALAAIILLTSVSVSAQPPILIDPQTGRYLGNYSNNRHDPNSTSNPNGIYGSPNSAYSVNNPHGMYGSPHSQSSANNPYNQGIQGPMVPGHRGR